MGLVYELPDMLQPNVWPWQAYHIWYVSPKLQHSEKWTKPETYFELTDGVEKVDIDIKKFKDRWMTYKQYSLV